MGVDKAALARVYGGDELVARIAAARVLVVGAGGIGCELLKNLVLSGFKHLDVIDLDTIDVSNLNRQLLFRMHHVSQSKAKTAREAVLQVAPDVAINAHHGSVTSAEYGISFFSQFDLVLNALDNLEARRHVNRLCIAAKKPLVESGTEAFAGQCQMHIPGKTECFECRPKPTPKRIPYCQIRSFPDKPVHCVMWAKALFQTLFGSVEEGEEIAGEDEDSSDLVSLSAEDLFNRLFDGEIRKQLSITTDWRGRAPPVPITYSNALKDDSAPVEPVSAVAEDQVGSLADNVRAFCDSLQELHAERERASEELTFDKDWSAAMRFVASAAAIRSHIFHIPRQSEFKAKEIVGNIVPAVATTNAVISGLIVFEAIKIISSASQEEMSKRGRLTYCAGAPSQHGLLLTPLPLDPPRNECIACQKQQVFVSIDTEKTVMRDFLSLVLGKELAMQEPCVYRGASEIYVGGDEDLDEEDLEFRESVEKSTLAELQIQHDTELLIVDNRTGMKLTLFVQHIPSQDIDEEEYPAGFIISSSHGKRTTENPQKRKHEEINSGDDTLDEAEPKKRREEEKSEIVVGDDDQAETIVLE